MAREDEWGAEGGESAPLDLRFVRSVLRRRRGWVIAGAVAALVPGGLYVASVEPVYQAGATVTFQGRPEVLDFAPDFMPSGAVSYTRSVLPQMMTVASSDAVLGRVAEQLPPSEPPGPSLRDTLVGWVRSSEPAPGPSQMEERVWRIEALRRSMTLTPVGGDTALRISFEAADAESAAFLANATVDAMVGYLDELRQDASRRAITWLNQKIAEVRDEIHRREEAKAELVARTNVVPTRSDEPGQVDGRSRLTRELEVARLDLLTLEQQVARLAPSMRRSPDRQAPEELDALRTQYLAARQALELARLRYTPTHPEVIRLEAEAAELAARLGPEGASGADEALYAERAQEYRRLKGEQARAQARVNTLQSALDELEKGARAAVAAQVEYDRHEREIAIDRQILEVLIQRASETSLTATADAPVTRVLDYALPPPYPSGSRRRALAALVCAFALVAGVGAGFGRELLDRSVYSSEVVARELGVPCLGTLPLVLGPARLELHGRVVGSHAAESYRNLRTALLFVLGTRQRRTLLVTSAVAGEGKSTVIANLAASFAQTGRKVLLVDADMRRPRLDSIFSISRSPGLSELCEGRVAFEEAVHRPLGLEFEVLPSGKIPVNPTELLASQRLDELVADWRSRYDLVLIDSPVLLAVADALVLSAKADHTLLVHKPGTVDRAALSQMRAQFARAGARVVGFVFNQVDPRDSYSYPAYLESPYLAARGRFGRRPPRTGSSES